jgi:hypothetical protein
MSYGALMTNNEDVKPVKWEWFKKNVLKGWTARLPVTGTLDSEQKKYPSLKFSRYQVSDPPGQEQQGTWAAAKGVPLLLLERDVNNSKVVFYHDPPKGQN